MKMSGTPTLTSGLSTAGSAPSTAIAVPPGCGVSSARADGVASVNNAASPVSASIGVFAERPGREPFRVKHAIRLLLSIMPRRTARLQDRQRSRHLVRLDHDRLVGAEPRLRELEIRPASKPDMRADARRLVGLIGRAAEARAHAMRLAIKHRLDRVVDAAEVGRLDLHVIGSLLVGEELDVGKRVAPFIRDQAERDPLALQEGAHLAEALDLLNLRPGDDRRFDEKLIGRRRLAHAAEIIGERLELHLEEFAERAVDVEMDARPIIAIADLADALRDLAREGDELLALEPDMLLDQGEGGVRQELDALQDHPVELQRIVLVAGGEDRDGLRRDLAAIFLRRSPPPS